MEVYIDDMLVKYKEHPDHFEHLQEAFELLRAYDMKLNPSSAPSESAQADSCFHGDSEGYRIQPRST